MPRQLRNYADAWAAIFFSLLALALALLSSV